MHNNSTKMHRIKSNQQILIIFCLSIAIIVSLASNANLGSASPENKILMQPQGTQNMSTTTNSTNIVLVHGAWADGSSWSKEIPILKNAGHKVIAVQLPLHSLADDVDTVSVPLSTLEGRLLSWAIPTVAK